MPTRSEAEKIYNAIKKNSAYYDRLNDEGKSAYWGYARDSGFVTPEKLNDNGKAEFNKYVKTNWSQYEPKITPSNMADVLKYDSHAARQGVKVPLTEPKPVIAPVIAPTKRISGRQLEDIEGITAKPQPTKSLVGNFMPREVEIGNAPNPLKPLSNLALGTLNTINSVVQSPATMGKYGTQEMNKAQQEGKNPALGLLKGYGIGLGKAITGQEAVSNTEVVEGIAPKTTTALKEKYPGAYKLASEIVNYVDITDLTGLGILGDLAKVQKLGKLPDTTKALIKANAENLANISIKTKAGKVLTGDEQKLVDAIKQDIMYVDPYGNVRKTQGMDLQLEAPKQNLPKVDEFKTMTKNVMQSDKEKLYREVGVDRLESYFDDALSDAPYGRYSDLYVAKNPIYAIGQGKNKGIKLEFSSENVPLKKVNKPMNFVDGEYVVDDGGRDISNMQKYLRPNLEKITIDKNFIGDVTREEVENTRDFAIKKARFNNVTLRKIRAKGWEESLDKDGNIVFVNPQKKIQPPVSINQTLKPNKPIQSALDARLNKPQIAPSKNIDAPFRLTPAEQARIKPLIDTPKPLSNINTPPIEKTPLKSDSSVKLGKATWKNKDYDAPIEVMGDYGTVNGKRYVKIKGSDTGVPLDEIRYTDEVAATETQNIGTKPIGKLKNTWNKFYSATVNNTQATANVSKEADIMNTVARNSGATVDHIIKKGLVNMEGQKIEGKAISDIFDMPEKEAQALEDLLFETHNIDRVKQGKELTGRTTEESKLVIDLIKKQYPHLEAKAKEVNTLLKNMLDEWGVKSGLVDTDLRNLVQGMYQNYVPGYRELPGVDAVSFKSRGMGPAKIINKAIGGDDKLMSLQKSIPMLISKTVKSARKNELYREIYKAAQEGSPYAKVLEPAGKIEEVLQKNAMDKITEAIKADGIDALTDITDSALAADPKLGYLLTVMDNGKPVKLQIKEELFKSLQALNGKGDDDLQAALKLFKKGITNPFKSLITGYNPMFAIRNVARDIPTAYIQGTENNPIKFGKNLFDAGKDMIKNADGFKEYQALGGEGGNYFNVEKGIKTEGKLEKVLKPLAAINNFTETLPRYAEYKGTLKREGTDYATKMKALNNSQEVTVNFGRHGDVTKAIDAVLPYLNPAVQGLDKTARTFKKPEAWAKALGVITVPTAAIYAMNQIIDKSGYDQLDNRSKDTYFVFPMGNSKFIKIPKTRESGVMFGALFERIFRQVEGQSDAYKGFSNTVKTNFLIQNPFTDNIASAAVTGLKYNKDFADRNVIPQYMLNDKRSPRLQFDEKTSEIANGIGDKFNISPKQIDYIMDSYGGIIADILIPAATKGGNVVETVAKRPFTADAAYSNEITNSFYGKLDKLKQAATDKNIKGNLSSKLVTPEEKISNLYQGMTRQVSNIRDEITKLGATDEARQQQQKLLNILAELNRPVTYNEAERLKQELITMASTMKRLQYYKK